MNGKSKSPEILIMSLCWIFLGIVFLITILTGWM